MAGTKKCAHPACNCQVAAGQKYCSTKCESSRGMMELTCQCGHPDCEGVGMKG